MEDPSPPLDTPRTGGWDPVSKPGWFKALNASGASGLLGENKQTNKKHAEHAC